MHIYGAHSSFWLLFYIWTSFGRYKAVWATSFGSEVDKGVILGVEGSNCDFGFFRATGGPLCNSKMSKNGHFCSFLLIFTVLDLSRPLEGRFGCYILVGARYGLPGGGKRVKWSRWGPCAAKNL